MKSLVLAALAAFLFSACTPVKPDPVVVVKTQRVEVPVIQHRKVPEALAACGADKPAFHFFAIPGSPDAGLHPDDQHALMDWVDGKDRCRDAWREWSK